MDVHDGRPGRSAPPTLRSLQELTRLKAGADPVADAAWLLVLEAMIFRAEAEVRWLDHCETRSSPLLPAQSPHDRATGGAPHERRSSCATCSRVHGTARPPCTRCAACSLTVEPGELVAVMGP